MNCTGSISVNSRVVFCQHLCDLFMELEILFDLCVFVYIDENHSCMKLHVLI